jgi:hypothetical protein
MRCGSCHHEWIVTQDWLDRFNRALEACPMCGTDCRAEDRPQFYSTPGDPLNDDSAVRGVYWYHSSTHANWPNRNFDPTAFLTDVTKHRMEKSGSGVGAVARWAERQKAKALHVGTYEAAIENVFRRIDDQGDALDKFHLYRVQLSPLCAIAPGVHQEPTDWMGNAYLADVCPPVTNVFRYVNVHEDPSSVSLALEASAIGAVQRIVIPLPVDSTDPWVAQATARLVHAATKPSPPSKSTPRGWSLPAISALSAEARTLESEIASHLPLAIGDRFNLGFDEYGVEANATAYSMKLVGLARLVTHAQAVFDSLDGQPWREIG